MRLQNIVPIVIALACTLGCTKQEKIPQKSAEQPNKTATESPKKAPKLATRTTILEVQGMTCESGCGGRVSRALAELDGIKKLEMNFKKKQFRVTYDPAAVTEKDFVVAVTSCGDEAGNGFKASVVSQ